MNKSIYIIKKPLITEKGTISREKGNQYFFKVDTKANKLEIKKAIEELFNVKVLDVNTLIQRGKIKRVGKSSGKQSNWKKAIVTLKEGNKIDFFEGA